MEAAVNNKLLISLINNVNNMGKDVHCDLYKWEYQ